MSHTDGVVLVSQQHPLCGVVVEGGDGASLPGEILQTPVRSLGLAVTRHLGHLDSEGSCGGSAG